MSNCTMVPTDMPIKRSRKRPNKPPRSYPLGHALVLEKLLLLQTDPKPNPHLNKMQNSGKMTLWYFILKMLSDPTMRHVIAWTGNPLEFKFVDKDAFTQQWGFHNERASVLWSSVVRIMRSYNKTVFVCLPDTEHSLKCIDHTYRFITDPSCHLDITRGELDQFIARYALTHLRVVRDYSMAIQKAKQRLSISDTPINFNIDLPISPTSSSDSSNNEPPAKKEHVEQKDVDNVKVPKSPFLNNTMLPSILSPPVSPFTLDLSVPSMTPPTSMTPPILFNPCQILYQQMAFNMLLLNALAQQSK